MDPEYHLVTQHPSYHKDKYTNVTYIEHKIPSLIVTRWQWRYINNINMYQYVSIDAGASSHFYPIKYKGAQHNPTADPIRVGCANKAVMVSLTEDIIYFNKLSLAAKKCHKYCTGDISNMYLMSNFVESEYVKFNSKLIPQRIINHYNLNDIVEDGYVYTKINKTWFGLKQRGKIAHNDLVQHLNKHGYPSKGYRWIICTWHL